jgi:hypothetical protein
MFHATTRAMSEPERQAATRLLTQARRRGSAWHFAARPLIAGVLLLVAGLAGLFAISLGGKLSGPAGPGTPQQAGVLAAAAIAVAGLLTAGFGFSRLMLGLLMAGRTRELTDQTLRIITAELAAGQVEQIDATLSAATRLAGMPSGRAWIARAGDHLLAIDATDLGQSLAHPAAHSPGGTASGPAPATLLRSLQLVVLPTSRRVLSAANQGQPLTDARAIDAAMVPDFARGYRPLRIDHFPESVRGDLP